MVDLKRYNFFSSTKIFILVDQFIVSGVSFLITIILARGLGPTVYGQYILFQAISFIVLSVNQALFTMPMQQLTNLNNEKIKEIMTAFVLFNFTILVVILVLFFSYSFIFDQDFSLSEIIVFSSFLFFPSILDLYRKIKYQLSKFFSVLLYDVFVYVFISCFLVVMYYHNTVSIYKVCLTFALSELFFGYFFLKNITSDFKLTFFKDNWKFSKWLLGTVLLQWFSSNFLITFVGITLEPAIVGVIRVGQSIIGIPSVLFQILENYFPSKFSLVLKEKGLKGLLHYFNKIYFLGFIPFIGFSILFFIFNHQIIEGVFGSEYLEHKFTIVFFGLILISNYAVIPIRFIFRAINKTDIIFYSYILNFVFSFIMLFTLVQWKQEKGLVFSILLSQVIMLLFYFIYLLKIIKNENISSRTWKS